ncbi:hypothetical protein [uncultured Rhodoblastus sp.]|uniref:hypothetical protein n=1 Tax=uncultured Rhodoblastus sp. TaxID=543037 RepID=UPI0025E3E8E2|nr:hypothetical protein [uncultured Rhodoblastus sp.]
MSKQWPLVKLRDVLKRSEDTIALQADATYREITVKMWGKGVVLRGTILGAEIASARRFVAKTGQFILSRIDARNGAIGIVPPELDGAVVTNDFPLFYSNAERISVAFLAWLSRTSGFVNLCVRASEGTTNRVRLQEDRFLALEIPLPPVAEQRRLVARIEELATKLQEIRQIRDDEEKECRALLLATFWNVARNAPRRPMAEVAPLIRRPTEIQTNTVYPELGIRSFGHGTFHKPALSAFELGSKRIFRIERDDLLFSNVFAWEGAIAVAKPEDHGRFGSHRFMSCVPRAGVATSQFLRFYFLTNEGIELIRAASPGGAGRNRTLGIEALTNIKVPVPPIETQKWFDALQAEVDALKSVKAETAAELNALLPSILDRAFAGEL